MSVLSPLASRAQALAEMKSRPSGVSFGLKLAVYLMLIAHGVWFALSTWWPCQAIGVTTIGLMFAHGVELQHQALHQQGFRSRRLNTLFGVLLGLPMLVSFHAYQDSHLRHHRLLGTPENREYFDYGDQYGSHPLVGLGRWIWRLSMAPHYLQVLRNFGRLWMPGVSFNESPAVSKAIRRDHAIMLAVIAALCLVSALLHSWLAAWIWLASLAAASPVHALVEMPEHYRCELDSTDPCRNTRTIASNAFMTWFTNGNNYHVEHHMMPGLPIERLHDLHGVIAPRIRYYHRSYRDFYGALLRGRLALPDSGGDTAGGDTMPGEGETACASA